VQSFTYDFPARSGALCSADGQVADMFDVLAFFQGIDAEARRVLVFLRELFDVEYRFDTEAGRWRVTEANGATWSY
jgi:hypothetical protein